MTYLGFMSITDRRQAYKKYYAANRESRIAYSKKYYIEHNEHVKERRKRYYDANKERLNAQHRLWTAANKEHIKEYDKKRRDANRERDRENSRRWRAENPDRVKEYNKQWDILNRDKRKRLNHNYRARVNGNGGSYTLEELNSLFAIQDYLCYYCGTPFFDNTLNAEYHIDHKIPLSRGGTNDISNLVISCPVCNLSKHTKTTGEFLNALRGDDS
jgi:5-methylcytosine-specific restriction endonuclease McrA